MKKSGKIGLNFSPQLQPMAVLQAGAYLRKGILVPAGNRGGIAVEQTGDALQLLLPLMVQLLALFMDGILKVFQHLQQVGVFRQPCQQVLQVESGLYGNGGIYHKHNGKAKGADLRGQGRQGKYEVLHDRLDKLCQKNSEYAPCKGRHKADIATHIKFVFAVIPVPGMEDLFHGGAGDVLQKGGTEKTENIYQNQIVAHRKGGQQDDNSAKAVNRDPGTMKKSAVHPFFLTDRNVAGFPDPAEKAVAKEDQDPLRKSIKMHFGPPRLSCN